MLLIMGPGMGRDILERARIKRFTTKAYGNGLGLHIVDILSREIGATFNLESEPGGGTKVEISLPLEIPGAAADTGR